MVHVVVIAFRLAGTDQYIWHRRDDKAPVSPNLLGLFGGHIDQGEDAKQAIKREIAEETDIEEPDRLEVTELFQKNNREYRAKDNSPVDVWVTGYLAELPDADFEVFEGVGKEIHTIEQILRRKDIAPNTKMMAEFLQANPQY